MITGTQPSSAPECNDAAPSPLDPTLAVAIGDEALLGKTAEALHQISIPVLARSRGEESVEELLGWVRDLRPSILLLGLPGLPADPAVVVSMVARLSSAPHIVVVNDSADGETILRVMRAGAAEYIYPPLDAQAFQEVMARAFADCARRSPEERTSGRTIGFVSAKGGCGATTLACHASRHVRCLSGKEVLLADLDPASGIVGTLMQTSGRYGIDDALQNLHRMDLNLWKALVTATADGVDVMPAAPEDAAPGLTVARRIPQLLRFWRSHYDFAFLDLGRGVAPPLTDLLEALDELVVVTTNELPALRQAKQTLQSLSLRNFPAKRIKLVINRMPCRTELQLPELGRVMGHPIFAALPNDYRRLSEAYAQPRLLGSDSDLGRQLERFAEKLTGVAPATKASERWFLSWRKK